MQLLQVAVEVGGAMAYLHPQVVHRDLKSQNVVFGQDKAKVCDFGIAKFKERYVAVGNCIAYRSAEFEERTGKSIAGLPIE